MIRTHTIKRLLLIGLILVMIGMPLFGEDVAAASGETSSAISNFAQLLYFLVSLLSWLWVTLAAFAGKLMTNDLVFGGIFHMDYYLLQIWIIVKNLANFLLGLGFIVFIARELWSGDVDIGGIAKQIGGFVLAGLLINFSFFIVQALVDISTIGVTAMGGMSSMFVSNQSSFSEDITRAATSRTRTIFQKDGKLKTEVTNEKIKIQEIMDTVLPKANTLAGPLVFLGSNVLNIQKFTLLHNATEESIDSMLQGKNLAIGFLVQLAIVGTFSLALFVLVIANIVRIGMIRILVSLGPLFFLIWGLKRGGVKIPGGIEKLVENNFKFSAFVKLIFLPVFTTLMLSLALIFSTTLWSTLQSGEVTHNGVTIDANDGTTKINDVIDLTYSGNYIGDSAKDVFADFIVAFATIFLLWMIARYSIPKDTPIVGSVAESIFDLAKTAVGSQGIIPIPGTNKKIGISGLSRMFSSKTNNENSLNPISRYNAKASKRQRNSSNDINAMTSRRLGIQTGSFVSEEISQINKTLNTNDTASKKLQNFFDTIKKNTDKDGFKTFEFRADSVFTDETLKTLQPILKSTHRELNNINVGENTTFYVQKTIKYLLEQLKNRGFEPKGATPTTLDSFKKTVFEKKTQ